MVLLIYIDRPVKTSFTLVSYPKRSDSIVFGILTVRVIGNTLIKYIICVNSVLVGNFLWNSREIFWVNVKLIHWPLCMIKVRFDICNPS